MEGYACLTIHSSKHHTKLKGIVCLVALLFLLVPYLSHALPEGGALSQGNASITAAPGVMNIQQSTDKAVINWQSFNIGAKEQVNFQQPHASSITLNRINPNQGVSQVFGSINANGRVWLVNPAGIWFGPQSNVNVAGLLATTANILDQDFMNGHYRFLQDSNWNGAIINEGHIVVHSAGLAALVGNGVVNRGLIEANLGTVVLATGKAYTVDFSGDQLINFAVGSEVHQPAVNKDGKSLDYAVENTGKVIAHGGKVLMSARTASQMLDRSINMSNIVEAKSVGVKNGQIILMAPGGKIQVSGKMIASGKRVKERGGNVRILAKHIVVKDHAEIDVSGDRGGGEVLIGGDYQGKNPNLPNAHHTFIGKHVSIKADALNEGSGGTVIAWADDATEFYGNISARGGMLGGDGGLVETSGKAWLVADGLVDASAPQGRPGQWLLDPANVTISALLTINGLFDGLVPTNTFTTTANTAIANVVTIITALNLGTNVTILTTPGGTQAGDITVSSVILKSLPTLGTPKLTLNASGAILVNNNILSTAGALDVEFISNSVTIANTAAAAITTNGGNFSATTQNAFTMSNGANLGTINVGSGTVNILVNQDGLSNQSFTMAAGSGAGTSITSTNTSANAVNITVNTSATSGSGTAALRDISVGSGGTISVVTSPTGNTAGGSITQPSGTLDTGNGTITLTTSQTGGRAIGTSSANMTVKAGTLNLITGSGDAFVTNTNTGGIISLDFGFVNLTDALTLTSLGSSAITSTGPMTVPGITSITAGTSQNVTLNHAANNFGTLAFPSVLNATVTDSNGLILGASTVSGALSVTAGGAISQSGIVSVTGIPTFTVSAPASNILLDTQANQFSTTPVLTNNGNVQDLGIRNTLSSAVMPLLPTGMRNLSLIFNDAAMTLPAVSLTGTLTATAKDAISQAGAILGTTLTAKTLNDGGAAINLSHSGNDFSTVNLQSRLSDDSANAAGVIQYMDSTGFNVSLLRTTNNATLTGNGALGDTGDLTIGGIGTFSSGDDTLNFNTASNDFNTVIIPSAGNTTLVDANALVIGGLNSSGTLSITTAGALTQTGLMSVTGTTTLSAGAGNSITLDSFSNEFATVRVSSGLNVKLKDANAIVLGTSDISGTFDVTAGGDITQNNILTVAGTPTFTLTAANSDISLATSNNNFTLTPVITNNGNVRDLLLRNMNSSALPPTLPSGLRALTLSYPAALSLTLPGVTLTGNLSLTANGIISQSGPVTALTATFAAGASNNVIFNDANNDFTTTVITNANNVTLRDSNALTLGTSTVSGNYSVTTGGAIIQSGTQTVTGATTLEAGSHDITLATSTNNFNTVGVTSGNNVSLRDTNALIVDSILAGGTLTLRSGGDLTQAAASSISATGTTTLIAGTSNIDLSNAGNDFSSLVITSGNNVSLLDTNALVLGASTISGNLAVTAGGTLSQSGVLSVTGVPSFTLSSPTTDILLSSQANNFASTPLFTNNGNIRDLALRNTNATAVVPVLPTGLDDLTLIFNAAAMTLPSVTLSGALTTTSSGTLSQAGVLTGTTLTAKTLNTTPGGSPINLSSFANEFNLIDLRVRNSGDTANVATAINYKDVSGVEVANLSTGTTAGGNINLTTGAAMTQSGAITANLLTAKTLNNAGADISLNNSANAMVTVDLSTRNAADTANAAGNIIYRDSTAVDLANISTSGLANIIATAITQSGAITASTLQAKTLNSAGGAINLANLSNEVASIDLRARNATDSANDTGAITYTDASGFDVATIGTASTIQLTGGGPLTDSGNITGTTLTTHSSGGTFFNFGHNVTSFNATNITSDNIELSNTGALTITGVNLTGGGDLALNNTGTTTVTGAIDTGLGNMSVISTGDVTDSKAGSITTQALLIKTLNNTPGGADISLNNVASHASGSVDFRTRNANDTAVVATPIVYVDVGGFNVAGIQTGSTVNLTGGGDLSQTGAMIGSNLTVLTLNNAGAGIDFNHSSNDFNNINLQSRNAGNAADASGTIHYQGLNDVNITGLRTLGEATIFSGRAISDTGVLVVGTLETSSVGGVVLNNANQITNFHPSNSGSGSITLVNTASPLTITGFSQSGGGIVSLTNTGGLRVANGVTIAANANIAITASDLDLMTSGSINSGSSNTTVTQNTAGGSIGLGTTGTMSISDNEWGRITANLLSLIAPSNGSIMVDGLSLNSNIASTTLTATTGTSGSIQFQNNPSYFSALAANADDGILIGVGANLTTTTGNMSLDGDAGGGVTGNEGIYLSANLSAAGQLTLSSGVGGIQLNAPVQLEANGISFQDVLNGSQDLTLNAFNSDIEFNANVGQLASLNTLQILSAGNITSQGVMFVRSIESLSSGVTSFNGAGIQARKEAVIEANQLLGNLFVEGLTINLSTGNFSGMINGERGVPAIRLMTVLNTLLPNQIFFDGIDIYSVLKPTPPTPSPSPNLFFTVPSQVILPNDFTNPTDPSDPTNSKGGLVKTVEELMLANMIDNPNDIVFKKISTSCVSVGPLIMICSGP